MGELHAVGGVEKSRIKNSNQMTNTHALSHMFFLASFGLLTVVLSACARPSSAPVSAPEDKPVVVKPAATPAPPPVAPTFELKETYKGEVLHLQFPDKESVGSIVLRDRDATIMYSLLLSVDIPAKDPEDGVASKFRYGAQVFCWQRAPATHSSVPQAVCRLDFNYLTGMIDAAPMKSKFKERPNLASNYAGKYVTMFSDLPDSLTNLQFKGKDAEALFWTLQIPIKEIPSGGKLPASLSKETNHMNCIRYFVATKKVEYACNLNFNYRSGEVIPLGTN
jgi:hypothetical protein